MSALGLDPNLGFEVHQLRRAIRTTPDGRYAPQIVASLTQWREIQVKGGQAPQIFRGGSTLIVDLSRPAIQYTITKRVNNGDREAATREFFKRSQEDPLRALLIGRDNPEPFAALHLLAAVGGF